MLPCVFTVRQCLHPRGKIASGQGLFDFERMYAVKVNVKQRPEDIELSEEASRLATELLAEQSLDTAGSSDHIQDEVSFSAGNPRVEHVTGKVHLYRQVSSDPFSHQLPVS